MSAPLNMIKSPYLFFAGRSRAMILLWLSDALFVVRVTLTFLLMFFILVLVRFRLLSDRLLEKSCYRLNICPLSIFIICNFSYFPFRI